MCVYIVGSSLTSCAVRGQQCCGQSIIDLFNSALGNALGGDTLDLVSGFDGAQVAIDRLRNEIDGNNIICFTLYIIYACRQIAY